MQNQATATAPLPQRLQQPETRSLLASIDWRKPAAALGGAVAGVIGYNLLYSDNSLFDGAQPPVIDDEYGSVEGIENGGATNADLSMSVAAPGTAMAESVHDGMSFDEAFAGARQEVGPGGFFRYRGRYYNTYTEEEFDALGPGERQEFADNFVETISNDPAPPQDYTEGASGIADNESNSEEIDTNDTEAVVESDSAQFADSRIEGESTANVGGQNINSDTGITASQTLDMNNDGTPDTMFFSTDDDTEAEIVVTETPQTGRIVLIDSGNTGMLDMVAGIDANGNLTDPIPLAEPVVAPVITQNQNPGSTPGSAPSMNPETPPVSEPDTMELDLDGDGLPDHIAADTNHDGLADEMVGDLDGDGQWDVVFFDTQSNGTLDSYAPIVNGEMQDITPLDNPLRVPLLDQFNESEAPVNTEPVVHDETDEPAQEQFAYDDDEPEIEGLDNDADVGDFL